MVFRDQVRSFVGFATLYFMFHQSLDEVSQAPGYKYLSCLFLVYLNNVDVQLILNRSLNVKPTTIATRSDYVERLVAK